MQLDSISIYTVWAFGMCFSCQCNYLPSSNQNRLKTPPSVSFSANSSFILLGLSFKLLTYMQPFMAARHKFKTSRASLMSDQNETLGVVGLAEEVGLPEETHSSMFPLTSFTIPPPVCTVANCCNVRLQALLQAQCQSSTSTSLHWTSSSAGGHSISSKLKPLVSGSVEGYGRVWVW